MEQINANNSNLKRYERARSEEKELNLEKEETDEFVEPSCCDCIFTESCQSRAETCVEYLSGEPVKSSFYQDDKLWLKFLYDGKNIESEKDIIDLIIQYADDKEYFDIYQMCAFDSKNDPKAYKRSLFKAILCLLLQIPSIVYIVYNLMDESEKSWCNLNYEWSAIWLKCLAFGYSVYLTFYIDDLFAIDGDRGLNCIHSLWIKPPFLNYIWIQLGGLYNWATCWCALVGSYMIIFLADNPVDLILNSVALFFLIEIDDMLVTTFDYWKVKKFFEEYKIKNYNEVEDNQDMQPIGLNVEHCLLSYELFGFVIYFILKNLRYLAPVYIGVCS